MGLKGNPPNSALDTFRKVKKLSRHRQNLIGTNVGGKPVYHSKTPCFLIAYSGPTKRVLIAKLSTYGKSHKLPIDEYTPEAVRVLDWKYCVIRNNGWILRKRPKLEFCSLVGEECHVVIFIYVFHRFRPLSLQGVWCVALGREYSDDHRLGAT